MSDGADSAGRSTTVGLIIGDVANPFYARIARGAERVLRRAGLQLITASSDEHPDLEFSQIADMLDSRVSGLLVVTCRSDHTQLDADPHVPVVFLDRAPEDRKADVVLLDNAGGIRQAVDHLLALGHTRIGLVGDLSRLSTHRERVDAFRAALADAGIDVPDRYIRTDSHDIVTAERSVWELLAMDPAPTALIATNNRITIGALRAIRESVPAPALVGFDDFELADLLAVSVVAHDPEEMGRLGAEILLGRIDGDDSPPRREVLSTRLVARTSSERPAELGERGRS